MATIILFFRIFWSIFWRSVLVLIVNAIITYGLSAMLNPQSVSVVKIRLSVSLLPAIFIFAALAAKSPLGGIFEEYSLLSNAQWRQTYFGLCLCSLISLVIVSVTAPLLETDAWLALRSLLPMALFLIFWVGTAAWQTRSAISR
ncbi:hypothetical protein [Neorhizobium galegae]|uniref:hypothetical protein n=1 Tax=Neorhizobium galegae TaxID=399 RepID=UPI00062815D3|nr:hypothetical protein [Neorhizobium galegae]KAB1121966.1 hypothetical protein F4V90_22470 [Neorhizobium galegae]MCQ1574310.1 hypothetical protein [Neorhizobium galegae]MCQ1809408.1 hypothetical protein [Neorhizobium galegae]MCQ1837690.1 hypothetical protein [Neorhizobium galegae]